MGGRTSRRKGHGFERQIAKLLRESTGLEIRRGWQARDGHDAPDVICPGFWIECKCMKRSNPKKALEQAIEASRFGKNGIPVAVTKDDGGPILVTMGWDDWLAIAREEMVKSNG